jgi:8-oxo-dGTP pyrophosphatase MutT (NUDIX family)
MGKKMHTTCGVIITDGRKMLICHPTNGRNWDLPKGRLDPGEEVRACAVRELREETSIVCDDPDVLTDLGLFDYKPSKRLHLFRWDVADLPDPVLLTCTSLFEWHGRMIPEMDAFQVTTIEHAIDKVNPDLARILISIFKPA